MFLFSFCRESGVIINEHISLDDREWSDSDSIAFEFSIPDTSNMYDIYLNLRISNGYKWSNLYVFTDLKYPNNKIRRDTFEFFIADPYGKWTGKNSGSVVENQFLLYSNSINSNEENSNNKGRSFPLTGKYSLSIYQAMREFSLSDILDVGDKIKKIEKG